MERYNYFEELKNDVIEAIEEGYNFPGHYTRDELEEVLNDDLWTWDSVTGNGSGSYFFSTWKAEEALAHNWDLLKEAYEAFGYSDIEIESFDPESADVTIRCYLLPSAICEVLDNKEDNFFCTVA